MAKKNKEEVGQQPVLLIENDGESNAPLETTAPPVSQDNKEQLEQLPDKKNKYLFGEGVFTDDKALVNEYLQLSQKFYGDALNKRSIAERLYILFNKINKLVPTLKMLADGNWRENNNQMNKACNRLLMDLSLSNNEKRRIYDVNLCMSDLMLRFVESRKGLFVIYNIFLHHQTQLSHILHKKPGDTLLDETTTDIDC